MKKKEFGRLKPGDKFRWKRKLCVKDNKYCGVELTTGRVIYDNELKTTDLVMPVRLIIRVK